MEVDYDTSVDESVSTSHPELNNGGDWVHCIPKSVNTTECPLRDISHEAVWTLSSCKTDGFGVYELLHDSVDKYWQSDGPQPHTITVEFSKITDISFLWLYLDYKNDESYTPSKVVVFTGSSRIHLDEGTDHAFNEPNGWQYIDLRDKGQPVRAMVVHLQVVHNHQNGRDTHIRHVRVAGPSRSRFHSSNRLLAGNPRTNNDNRTLPVNMNSKLFKSMTIR